MINSFRPIINLFAIFGLILLISGSRDLYAILQFRAKAQQVEGVVSGIRTKQVTNGSTGGGKSTYMGRSKASNFSHTVFYTDVVYHTPNGDEHIYSFGGTDISTYSVDDKVTICYDKDDPDNAQLAGWVGVASPVFSIVVGLIFVLLRVFHRKDPH